MLLLFTDDLIMITHRLGLPIFREAMAPYFLISASFTLSDAYHKFAAHVR